MTIDRIFALCLLILIISIPLVAGLYMIYNLWQNVVILIHLLRGLPPELQVVSNEEAGNPKRYAEIDTALRKLNMHLISKVQFRIPLAGGTYAWLYTSDDAETHTEVYITRWGGGQIAFWTCFNDEALVLTMYPPVFAGNIATPNFSFHSARRSIESAATFHREEVERFKLTHGDPYPIHTVEDTLYIDDVHRRRYRPLRLRANIQVRIINIIICLYGLSVFGLILVSIALRRVQSETSTISIDQILPIVGIGIVLYSFWQTNRQRKAAVDNQL